MPVEQEVTLQISCDNASCPGNSLDASDRQGWTFVYAEVYGYPTMNFVYCCPACAGTVSTSLEDAETARNAEAVTTPA